MAPVNDELEQLRKRAYGRGADIHLDSEALGRLRELEEERSPKPPVEPEEQADEPTESAESEPAPLDIDEPRQPREWMRRLSSVRRSTVVIALAVVAFAVAAAVVLALVQRVQTDPLQVGASQVARLGVDSGYAIPAIFGPPATGDDQGAQAFDAFHGLRPVVTTSHLTTNSKATTICLNLFVESDITDLTSTSFSGQFFSGCAAGSFPAMAQFDLHTDGLPAELHSAFPASAGLQFVYDEADDEVVIFESK